MTVQGSKGEINIHFEHGNPKGQVTPFRYDYTAPLSDETRAFIEAAFEQSFEHDIEDLRIIGAPWDYTQSDDPAYNAPQGYFRIQVDGVYYTLVSLAHNGEVALQDAAFFVDALRQQDVEVIGVDPVQTYEVPLGREVEVQDGLMVDRLYVHIEDYSDGAVPIRDCNIKPDAIKLGQMLGQIYLAGMNCDETLAEVKRLKEVTDQNLGRAVRNAAKLFEELDENIKDRIPQELLPYFEKVADIFGDEGHKRIVTAFNTIEKTICVRVDGELLLTSAHDSVGYGSYLPMLTQNASYDVGQTVSRIILDTDIYPDTATALNRFVEGYNETTGLNLTAEEALESAKLFAVQFAIRGFDFQSTPDVRYEKGMNEHVEHVLIPNLERVAERMRTMTPAPSGGDGPRNVLK